MSPSIKAWLLLGGIFIVGVVTGSALMVGLGTDFIHPRLDGMRSHWMPFLMQKLNLSDEQKSKIKPIVMDASNRLQALHREEVGRGSEIIQTANQQIQAILTPEQKEKLQKLEQEREKMFRNFMRSGGLPPREGGPPGPRGGPDMFPPPGPDDRMTPPSFNQTPTHVPPPAQESQTNAAPVNP